MSFRGFVPPGGYWYMKLPEHARDPRRGIRFYISLVVPPGGSPLTLRAHDKFTWEVVATATTSVVDTWEEIFVDLPAENMYGMRSDFFTIVTSNPDGQEFWFDQVDLDQPPVADDLAPEVFIGMDMTADPVVVGSVAVTGSMSTGVGMFASTMGITGSMSIEVDLGLYLGRNSGTMSVGVGMTAAPHLIFVLDTSGEMSAGVVPAGHARPLTTLPAPPAPAPPESAGVFPMPVAGGTTTRATMGKTVVMDTPTITDGVPSS